MPVKMNFKNTGKNLNYFKIIVYLFCMILLFLIYINPSAAEENLIYNRPGPENKPTEVKIGVIALDIENIDGATQTFTANVFMILQWEDLRLVNATKANRPLNLTDVWNPRIQIVNQRKLFKTYPDVVEISPEGIVSYIQRYWGTFAYPMNLKDFPLDGHSFEIKIVTSASDFDNIKFVIDEENTGIGDPLTVTDWKILKWELFPTSIHIAEGLTTLTGVVYKFEGKRLLGFYIIKVLLPLAMIIFMSWIIFFVNPVHVGPKISIAITAMLTLIAYRFLLGNFLPKISYITRMDYFLLGSSFLVFGVLIQTAITAKLTENEKLESAKAVDFWSRIIFPIFFVLIILASFFV